MKYLPATLRDARERCYDLISGPLDCQSRLKHGAYSTDQSKVFVVIFVVPKH